MGNIEIEYTDGNNGPFRTLVPEQNVDSFLAEHENASIATDGPTVTMVDSGDTPLFDGMHNA